MTTIPEPTPHRVTPVTADDAEALAEVARLFAEYSEWLSGFVKHTTVAEELEELPGGFAPPGGALLIAADASGAICGCVGVKRHSDAAAEIKRLFVREACRGTGLGHALFASALDTACNLGYVEALVSTIPAKTPTANAMYDRIGFQSTGRFEDHTHADVEIRYLRLDLGDWCA
ncbi:MAG: GNAT family N-acetyltransferase [Coriobacteriia bacterium]|nr:GNAT family N-acetyltransferase [Coriobacteriia bacterium]